MFLDSYFPLNLQNMLLKKITPGRLRQSSGIVLVLVAFFIINPCNGATTHKHDHHLNKERMEDGSYSPRDAHHHDGGEHNIEFDHEAILGNVNRRHNFFIFVNFVNNTRR